MQWIAITLFATIVSNAWGQNFMNTCPNITKKDLENIISVKVIDTCTIHDFHLVCLASSGFKNRYTYASAVARYTCTDNLNSVIGPYQITSQCSKQKWNACVANDDRDVIIMDTRANFSTPLREDCFNCIPPRQYHDFKSSNMTNCKVCNDDESFQECTSPNYDDITYCGECNEMICNEGLQHCYGRADKCCNYYNASTCVDVCPSPFLHNTEYDCVCQPGTTGYNCSEIINCGSLGDPENGNVSFSTTTYNSVANYSCNTGYNLTGDMSRTCLDTGLWSGSEPNCTVIDCGPLEDPKNGKVVFNTTYDSMANYSCNAGYTLRGDMTRTCLDTGLWSGSNPECKNEEDEELIAIVVIIIPIIVSIAIFLYYIYYYSKTK